MKVDLHDDTTSLNATKTKAAPGKNPVEAGSAVQRDSFDAVKVATIRAAIQEGRFKVDANAIAEKLVANAQETFTESVADRLLSHARAAVGKKKD